MRFSRSEVVTCHLSISDCVLLVVEVKTKKLIFAIPCQAVLGWSVPPPTPEQLSTYERDIHIYYGRGERISIGTDDVDSRDEIILRSAVLVITTCVEPTSKLSLLPVQLFPPQAL